MRRFACLVLTACCVLANAQPMTFTTFAGPAGGPGLADGTGGAARFNNPIGVAIDGGGNLYVADKFNHTIRKVSPEGTVTTLAGTAGSSGGVDGTGGTARFNNPFGVAVDGAGNVYVGGFVGQTIRKITPSGVVTTLAGANGTRGSADGAGGFARFADPFGVATDSSGNVYVADFSNNTIRKITPSGLVTTFAGSAGLAGSTDGTGGGARFKGPAGVAVDGGGNVYVADYNNDTIRKITPAGVVTTLAGSTGLPGSADGIGSAARFSNPTCVATDRSGNVYVTDENNPTIRKVTPDGVVTTVAGAPGSFGNSDGPLFAARFSDPTGLAIAADGTIYVVEIGNHTLRKITPAGIVSTLAGAASPAGSADGTGNAATFSGPLGMASDASGNVFVADYYNHTIRKITPAAAVVTTVAGIPGVSGSADGVNATFTNPAGVTIDGSGNVYVSDNFGHTIRRVSAGGVTTIAGRPGINGNDDGIGSAARFNFPAGLAIDGDGSIYVADQTNCTIRKITPAGLVGMVTTFAGGTSCGSVDATGGAARFNIPASVAVDSGGNVFVADYGNHTIRKITPAAVVTTFAGFPETFGSADGTGSVARFRYPEGVATDSGGNVYAVGNATIRRITPAGAVTTIGGSPATLGSADGTGSAARFYGPRAVTADRNGNVYVADFVCNKILVGRPALADAATIDVSTEAAGKARQLDTSPQTATSWQWRIIRQPSGSTAALSSTTIRNPLFAPDVADLYVFQLTASNGVNTSITTVSLTATPALPRRHAAGRN